MDPTRYKTPDEAIDAWQEGGAGSRDSGSPRLDVAALMDIAELWAMISKFYSWEWTPESHEYLESDLEEDRFAELAAGAEPTEEERELWQEEAMSLNEYAETVHVYRLVASDGRKAWFTWSTDGCHNGSSELDQGGPFLDQASLAAYLADKVEEWTAGGQEWEVNDSDGEGAETLLQEVRRLSGRRRFKLTGRRVLDAERSRTGGKRVPAWAKTQRWSTPKSSSPKYPQPPFNL
jgi:hypothetical protein